MSEPSFNNPFSNIFIDMYYSLSLKQKSFSLNSKKPDNLILFSTL